MKKSMKIATVSATVLLGLSILLYTTKPTQEKYEQWVMEKVASRSAGQDSLKSLGLALFGEQMIRKGTTASDYGVARIFHTEFQGRSIKAIGILGMVIPLGKPEQTG
ncbi:hypothetical protein H1230_24960 [Paenibacillus sp. 19GGS1-52]|uniref:DUF4359 domain-containing protein n=1 Tax=Paenibacillus sp. 19GGS1-52 TaxID=2758563 RepID=UPI001EFB2ED5|nr:DUF4359 domain-containing protein [Paenibacillus sp. 19GGS1-52]ULO06244.1 hypothetical protein H1230_24960 [Paenibacillus sp. 19GGS1-52]